MSAIALDPLIAEAKRRARLRRLLAAAFGITAAAVAVTVVVRDSERTRPVVVPAPTCQPAELRLLKPVFQGAYTGNIVMNFAFTNTSANACSLRGWPRFEVALAGGRTVAAAVRRGRNVNANDVRVPARTVVLPAGGAASFHVVVQTGAIGGQCGMPFPTVRTVVVPPGSSTPARGFTTMSYCRNPRRLYAFLSPVVAGQRDRYNPG